MREFRVVLPTRGHRDSRIAWGKLFKRYDKRRPWFHWGSTPMFITMETRHYFRFGSITFEWFTGENKLIPNTFVED